VTPEETPKHESGPQSGTLLVAGGLSGGLFGLLLVVAFFPPEFLLAIPPLVVLGAVVGVWLGTAQGDEPPTPSPFSPEVEAAVRERFLAPHSARAHESRVQRRDDVRG
jgi:hypothetical protein